MVERESPLGAALRPGTHGYLVSGPGVRLSEVTPPAILEATAWPGREGALAGALAGIAGLTLTTAPNTGAIGLKARCFCVGPGRYLVAGPGEVAARLAREVSAETATVTDLSHGRTSIRIAGEKAEWVLAKLFAIDFSLAAFPVAHGRATAHHDIFAQIQRTAEAQFDIFVFRSFARAFWTMLCEAAEEVGYEVAEPQRL